MMCFAPLAAFAHYLWPEVLHLTLFVVLLWVLSQHPHSLRWSAVAGLCLGLALLTKSLLGPFAVVLLVGAYSGDRSCRSWAGAAVVAVVAVATMAPVAIGQHERLGRLMIADSAGFNLWVGLNDRGTKSFEHEFVAQAYREYLESGLPFHEKNKEYRDRSVAMIRERGLGRVVLEQFKRQYFRLFDKDSYLTEQLPGGAAVLQNVGYREVPDWSAGFWKSLSYLQYALLLALAPIGFLLGPLRGRRWPRIMLVFAVYNLGLFLWLHTTSRYRIQMLPIAILGSTGALAWLTDSGRRRLDASSKVRIAAALGISLVLLALAFSRGFGPLL
jgi:hypothetical protein